MRTEISTRKDNADYVRLGAAAGENTKNYKELFNTLYERRVKIWQKKTEEKVKLYLAALKNSTLHLIKNQLEQPSQTSGEVSSSSQTDFHGKGQHFL